GRVVHLDAEASSKQPDTTAVIRKFTQLLAAGQQAVIDFLRSLSRAIPGDAAGASPSARRGVRPARPVAGARRVIRLRGRGGGGRGRRGRSVDRQRGTDEQRSNQDGDREAERALHARTYEHATCHAAEASGGSGSEASAAAPRRGPRQLASSISP